MSTTFYFSRQSLHLHQFCKISSQLGKKYGLQFATRSSATIEEMNYKDPPPLRARQIQRFLIDSSPSLKPEEVTDIINDFDEPGTLAPTGLFLGGTKYMVIQGEPGAVIRGKKIKCAPCFGRVSTHRWVLRIYIR